MNRKLLALIFVLIVLTNCKERSFNNPVDPDNINMNLPAPSDLSIGIVDVNVLKLNWNDNCEYEDAYRIERSIGTGSFSEIAKLSANSTEWSDSTVAYGNLYHYRVSTLHENYSSTHTSSSYNYRLLAPTLNNPEQIDATHFRISWQNDNHFAEGIAIDMKQGDADWQENVARMSEGNEWVYENTIMDSPTLYWRARAYYKSLQGPLSNEVNLTVAESSFDPPTGNYSNPQNVEISCATIGAKIRYTTDGSEPNESSALYSSALDIAQNTTLKAKAYMAGWTSSATATATYSLIISTPVISVPSGTYDVAFSTEISCSTPGAQIRYTTDGSEPVETSLLYTDPISIDNNTILKVKAFKAGWNSSTTQTAVYILGFVLVEGGTFDNGTSDVTLSSFIIDKYELTQVEYQAVMGVNPSYHTGYPNRPVEQVSWFDAIEYCNRRSMQEGLTPCYSYSTYGTNPDTWPGAWNSDSNNHTNVSCSWTANGYRLPTEMEWMFAAKGGNQTNNYTYSGSNTIGNVARYSSNSSNRTWDVGGLAANEIGTFDMSGNVWEWVWDIYGSYPSAPQTNPTGAPSGSSRVLRGGSWDNGANNCTVSFRGYSGATFSDKYIGFRCVWISP